MKNCAHNIPIDTHCDDCMSLLRGDEVRELRQQLAESEDKRFAIAKAIGEVKTSLDIAEIRIEKLQAELDQAESGKKYAIEWCKALQECAELPGMLPGDRITDVPKVLKAKLAQYKQADPVGYLYTSRDDEWFSEDGNEDPRYYHAKTSLYATPQPAAVVLPEDGIKEIIRIFEAFCNETGVPEDFREKSFADWLNGWRTYSAEVCRLNAETTTVQELERLRGLEKILDKAWMQVVAKEASERGAKNAKVSPQLLFGPFLWALQDAIQASQSQVE